ncbi:Uncharacterised protein [uncultured Ruminococcus sp.]|nr:Uncharacterised protein [uncultured Ruminococcus sp.]
MTKNEAIEKIMERIEEIKDGYDFGYIGVRVQEDAFVLGKTLDNSFVWVDGEITDEELNGTCAIRIDDAELAKGYYGDHVAIIGGDSVEYGQDLGEIIIRNAEVLEVVA